MWLREEERKKPKKRQYHKINIKKILQKIYKTFI